MGRPQSEDERAQIDHAKVEKIRRIRGPKAEDYDRKTPKSQDEQDIEYSNDIKLYDETFGED